MRFIKILILDKGLMAVTISDVDKKKTLNIYYNIKNEQIIHVSAEKIYLV